MKYEIAPKSTEIKLNWDDAQLYCFSLNIDGKIGWRLPTKEELKQIFAIQNDYENTFYWSSTRANGDCAWVQYMFNGYQDYDYRNSGIYYVRAIRDLKAN